jgi:enoyl-CoA hydratase/carnithine racemase
MEGIDPVHFADGKITVEVDDGVGLLTFNNPAKRNAMSIEMWEGLDEALGRLEEDQAVRVVVLTGAGHEAFVSGADISQFDESRSNSEAQREYRKRTGAGRDRLLRFPKPTIARVRGFCLGGGLAIAIAADVRIAAEDSSFGIPAAKLGIAYGLDMTRELVQLVGPAHARMLLYTGTRVDGAEAARTGLVNQVVPDEDLNERVVDLARTMADNAPLSIRAAKLTVAAVLAGEGERDTEGVEKAAEACFDSDDYREGRAAFKEKRPPRFQGR